MHFSKRVGTRPNCLVLDKAFRASNYLRQLSSGNLFDFDLVSLFNAYPKIFFAILKVCCAIYHAFSNNKVTIETQIEHIFMEFCQIFYLLRKHKKLRLANRCTLCVVIYFLILYSDFCINKKTCLPF